MKTLDFRGKRELVDSMLVKPIIETVAKENLELFEKIILSTKSYLPEAAEEISCSVFIQISVDFKDAKFKNCRCQ